MNSTFSGVYQQYHGIIWDIMQSSIISYQQYHGVILNNLESDEFTFQHTNNIALEHYHFFIGIAICIYIYISSINGQLSVAMIVYEKLY